MRTRQVPGSTVELTEAQLHDLFSAPDWFPGSHSPMPEVVARGGRPAVFACGDCHTRAGHGRPENAPLAGLPAAGANGTASCASCHGMDLRGGPDAPPIAGRSPSYLLRQLLWFRTGARDGRLAERMRPVVGRLSLSEVIAAVAYAGSLPP